jgi:DNA-binding NtrC family response regulator
MRKQPVIERNIPIPAPSTTEVLTVLSVSPLDEDHSSLKAIVGHSSWRLFEAHNVGSSLAVLQEHHIAVVVCERELLPGTYIDLLEHVIGKPNAPSLIVASRLADDRLWAEALNLGAWDVLAKPFHRSEVLRSVKSGWQRWHDQGTEQRMAATGT